MYTVLWTTIAVDQLAELWLAAIDRSELNQAVFAIDATLSREPRSSLSLELTEGFWTITVLPLRVIYAVSEPDRTVEVATLRRVS